MSGHRGVVLKIFLLVLMSYTLDCCTGCCDDEICHKIKTTAISLEILDNSGASPVIPQSDTIEALAFMIRMHLDMDSTPCASRISFPEISLTPRAMAFSCGYNAQLDSVSSFYIYADSDFSQNYPAGSDLTELFEFSSNPAADRYREKNIDLYLFSDPDSVKQFRFFAELVFTDGRVLRDSTTSIVLK